MSMWWDLKNTLSYNALFNFVVGSRGCGKTYGFKKWAAEDFIKTGINLFIFAVIKPK